MSLANWQNMSPDDTQKLMDWAETHPEKAIKIILARWAICGEGAREEYFNFRGAIEEARRLQK